MIVELPHDLLAAGHLEGVHARAAIVSKPIANQQVAALQHLDAGNVRKAELGHIGGVELPSNLRTRMPRFASTWLILSDPGVAGVAKWSLYFASHAGWDAWWTSVWSSLADRGLMSRAFGTPARKASARPL